MKALSALLLIVLASVVSAETLETKSYVVEIERNCPEGYVICDDVSYKGMHKYKDATINLKGTTSHTTCADGVSPCRFLGYEFRDGNIRYFVHDDGTLEVTRGKNEVLLKQKGQWINSYTGNDPVCDAKRRLPLDMVPNKSEFQGRFELVGEYNGKPCRKSTLNVHVRDTKSGEVLYQTSFSFSHITMHQTYTIGENLGASIRHMEYILRDTAKPMYAWPEFKFSTAEGESSLKSYLDPKYKKAQDLQAKLEANPHADGANELKQKLSALWETLYRYEDEPAFEYRLSRSEYRRLKASGAALFSLGVNEMAPDVFTYDFENKKVIKVNSKAS